MALVCHGRGGFFSGQQIGRTHTVEDKAGWKGLGKMLDGLPARAVHGDEPFRVEFLDGCDGLSDDRLKQGAGEMKSAEDCMNGVDTCYLARMVDGIDDARMGATRNDHQPLSLKMMGS